MIRNLVSLAVVSIALSAGSVSAQLSPDQPARSDGRGFSLGMTLTGSRLSSAIEQSQAPTRSGLGLTLRYGVSEPVSVFLRYDYGYQHGQTALGARYTFGNASQALRPYVEAAASRGVMVDADRHGVGAGIIASAGLEYSLSREVALDVGVSHSAGRFTRMVVPHHEVRGREGYSSTGLNVGFRLRL
jgi:outer membrane protein assembly factor BamA